MRSTLASLILLLAALTSFAAAPDLVVVIVIDQFPQEYIERFEPYFADGGFRRFMRNGAYFSQAWHPHATTYTCVGHATIGTGREPHEHGIVANEWYDETLGKTVYCVEDPRVRTTSGDRAGYSPVLLGTDSLGDRLQEGYDAGRAKVVGIGLKDRSGILMAGRKADAAYWFDAGVPGFVSSTYYAFNPRVLDFNARVPEAIDAHPLWEPSGLIPEEKLGEVTYDPPALRKFKGSPAFPHPIATVDAFLESPFANDLVLDFARHVIDAEWMGRADGAPDILWVGISATDYLGHEYGPDSIEVADTVVRLDRSIETFVADLEKRFGGRVTVAITADHGTQAIPEVATARGRRAGRIALGNPGANAKTMADLNERRRAVEKRAAKLLRIRYAESAPAGDRIVLRANPPNFYLNWDRLAALKIEPEAARRAVRDAILEIEGVAEAFTAGELTANTAPKTEVERAARAGFRADRSGDVIAFLEPGYIYSGGKTGSTHGQPVEADQNVPLMLWGAGVPKGVFGARVETTQLARTLGALLGVDAGTPGGALLPGFE